MNKELESQSAYWSRELPQFDAIYSKQKSPLGRWLDSVFRKDMYQRYEFTMQNSEPIAGRTFLDVGCGTGRYSLEYARRKCRRVVGIDISSGMVAECTKAAAAAGLSGLAEFHTGDLLTYEIKQPFDVCIGIGLFDYIKEPLPVLEKMRTSAREAVILSFPRLWTWRAPVRKIRLALRGCPVYFFSRQRVAALLKAAGLQARKIDTVGKLYCVVAHP